MNDEYIEIVSENYIELYENILDETFMKADVFKTQECIEGKG